MANQTGWRDVELEHFGTFLKKRREARGLSLADVSRATKIKETNLELLEAARLEALPAQVFVRGFVTAYAREVGIDEMEALRRYRAHLASAGFDEPRAQRLDDSRAAPADAPEAHDESSTVPDRRRFGVVMVVLLVLVVATLTLSLLLRHGRADNPGLSEWLSPSARSGPIARRL